MHFKLSIREIVLAMLSGAFIFTTPAAVNAMQHESHPNQAPASQHKKLYIPPHRRPADAGNSGNASSSSAAASPSAAAGSSASSRSSSVSPTQRRRTTSAWTGNNPPSIHKPPSQSVQHHAASAHLAGTSSKTSSQTATKPVGVFPEWRCIPKNKAPLNLADIQACLSDLLGQQQGLRRALISWLREKKHIVLPNSVTCKSGRYLPEKSFFESSVSFDTGRVAGCSVGKRTKSDLPPAIQCVVKGIKGCVVKANTAREVDSARAIISSDTGELISLYPSG